MKTIIIKLCIVLCVPVVSLAQAPDWNTLGNNTTIIGTHFLGTRDPMSLGFRTNNVPRMRIYEVGGDWRDGYLGVGNYFNFIPEAHVQIFNDLDDNFTSFKASNPFSGSLRNDGFSFGITGGVTNTGRIIQHEHWPIEIYTDDIILRMHINFDPTTLYGIRPITRVAIPEDGEVFQPLSILHLGLNPDPGTGFNLLGYRSWMDIGTLSSASSDQMYVGLMEGDSTATGIIWNDNMDAVVNWGDNVGPLDGANHLRFIFTSINGAFSTAATYQGLEVARFTPIGRMGIGNFSPVSDGNGSGIAPYRKLEVYDENLDGLLQRAAPQLRLTYGPGQTETTGIWTDFQTTSSGNLYINPSTSISGTPVNGNVGINTINPKATLEINANDLTANPGNSGLVFTDLNSSSIPATPNGKVLSLDGLGKVILTTDMGGNASVIACSGLTAGNQNYITKWKTITPGSSIYEICKTEGIYEMPSAPFTVGIGVGTSPNPWALNNFKLDMKGDLVLRHDFNNQVGGDIWMTDHTGTPPKRVFTMYGLGGFGTLALGPDAGSNSQFTATSASGCIYLGRNVGSVTANSLNNTFIGYSCGNSYNDVTGKNTIVGAATAGNLTTGSRNTFIGESSGNSLQAGEFNTYVGQEAGHGGIISGNHNVLIGRGTYINANSGDWNICLGSEAHAYNWLGTINNSISIGTGCRVSASNFITMGFQVLQSIPEQQIGLGYPSPPVPGIMLGNLAKLYVQHYGGSTASAFFNGDIYTSSVMYPSDSMLKDNIAPFTDASAFLNQLEAKTYVFKQSTFPGLNLPSGNQIGLLAEDIEMVAPQLVSAVSSPAVFDSIGNMVYPQVDFKAVNYMGLIPVLLTAIQQQKHDIDSLAIIVSQCCSSPIISNPGSENRASIQLSNLDMVVLNQNTPNPFNEKTEITYSIPEGVENAIILFYDQSGKVLQKYEISHRGQGVLTVFGEDLSSGIYSYTLMIDGKNNQTKRMIKQ